jgi:hypothetical protein
VISSRLVVASPVSFALFSAVKARKLQAPIFARHLVCTMAQGELVVTQGDQCKVRGYRCGELLPLDGHTTRLLRPLFRVQSSKFCRRQPRGGFPPLDRRMTHTLLVDQGAEVSNDTSSHLLYLNSDSIFIEPDSVSRLLFDARQIGQMYSYSRNICDGK